MSSDTSMNKSVDPHGVTHGRDGAPSAHHSHKKDEVLEALWTMREDGHETMAELGELVKSGHLQEIVAELIDAGMVAIDRSPKSTTMSK